MNSSFTAKLITISIPLFLLCSCAHYLKNPYDGMPKSHLRQVNSRELCSVVGDASYKINSNANHEAARRGFVDCSFSEVYCSTQLHLKPGSKDFAMCRLIKDEAEANRRMAQHIAASAIISSMQPKTVYVNHSGFVNVNHRGYINHYF